MSIERFRKLPIYERLFNEPMQGGPSSKHIHAMIKVLCDRDSRQYPDLNIRDGKVLATWLKANYRDSEIEWAHADRIAYYERMNKNRSRTVQMPKIVLTSPIAPPRTGSPEDDTKPVPKSDNSSEINKEETKNKKSDRKKFFNDLDSDEKYVLREEYNEDRETIVSEFSAYDKKINGQQKAIENALGLATKLENTVTDGLSALDRRLLTLEHYAPTMLTINAPNISPKPIETGIVHKQFPMLVKSANARFHNGTRLNIWLYGPAGTGKTHAGETLGKMFFGNENYYVSNKETMEKFRDQYNRDWSNYNYSPTLSTSFQIAGYNDANGRYVPTPFRLSWEFGGVFMLDEIDGSMPDALLALNGALSSTVASFPDGMVPRHPDCVVLAGANTTGMGGGIEYIGAMKQNAAFLNRWVWLEWPHDDALEDSLCPDKKWVRRVRQVRKNMEQQQIRSHLITMRQSMQGDALLRAGIEWEEVERMTLRGSLTDAQWERVGR